MVVSHSCCYGMVLLLVRALLLSIAVCVLQLGVGCGGGGGGSGGGDTSSSCTCMVHGWDVSLELLVSPSHAFGGEAFEHQPIVAIYNQKKTFVHSSLEAHVLVELLQLSPPQTHSQEEEEEEEEEGVGQRWESDIPQLGNMVNDECQMSSTELPRMELVGGYANFTNLCIDKAGTNYQLVYTLMQGTLLMGQLRDSTSSALTVSVGEAHHVGILSAPTIVKGGDIWSSQPVVVAILDRGGNVITQIHDGLASIALQPHPMGGSLLVSNNDDMTTTSWTSSTSAPFSNGTATFANLGIDVVGTNYTLQITTHDLTTTLLGSTICTFSPITVMIGDMTFLDLVEDPSLSSTSNNSSISTTEVTGGKAFLHQPLLHVLDAGRNLVLWNSPFHNITKMTTVATTMTTTTTTECRVLITIENNPFNATLSPKGGELALVQPSGVVQFRDLSLDKAGVGYKFRYDLYCCEENDIWVDTNVTVLGQSFNVEIGPAQALRLAPIASSITGYGHQPLIHQPKVELVDAGGNIVKNDSETLVSATLVPSLSQTSNIVIDTSQDPLPKLVSLKFHKEILEDGFDSYSTGHIIPITLTFTQEVFVHQTKKNSGDSRKLPTLDLDIGAPSSSSPDKDKAYLSNFTLGNPSKELYFSFTVPNECDHFPLKLAVNASLKYNDYWIADGWDRVLPMEIPTVLHSELHNSKAFEVNSSPAVISEIVSTTESGKYGAGQMLEFHVNFTRKVAVKGYPLLPLNVNSRIAIIDTLSLATSLPKSYFYIRYKNERSKSIQWDATSNDVRKSIEQMSAVRGHVCVSRSQSPYTGAYVNGYRWAIRFDSRKDDIGAGLTVEVPQMVSNDGSMGLNISYLVTDKEYVGWGNDMCTSRHAIYHSGSGSNVLVFRFTILPGDTSPCIDLDKNRTSIEYESDSLLISNAVNSLQSSAIEVNRSVENRSIAMNGSQIIKVDTSAPIIEDMAISGVSASYPLFNVGDTLYFNVTFDKEIVVNNTIKLSLNVGRIRNTAKFLLGSGTSTLMFEYIVLEGHKTSILSVTGIVMETGASIRRKSTYPTTDVNVTMPLSKMMPEDVPLSVDGQSPHVTDIYFVPGQSGRIFKEKENISIAIEFDSNVTVIKGPPALLVGSNDQYREAHYVSGNKSSHIFFNYTIDIGDSSPPSSIFCKMICVASGCFEGVSREGYIMQHSSNPMAGADLSLPASRHGLLPFGFPISIRDDGQIIVDTSAAASTRVVSVSSMHKNGSYGIGEVFRFHVLFSDAVFSHGGSEPELHLNTKSNASYEGGSGTNAFIFELIVRSGDEVETLNWMLLPNSNTSIFCDTKRAEPCTLQNANGQDVNLDFVGQSGQLTIPSLDADLSIDTTTPRVIDIYSMANPLSYCQELMCDYTAGDQIIFFLKFNVPVKVDPHSSPSFRLNIHNEKLYLNQQDTRVYALYERSLSNQTDLAFTYEIERGHSTKGQPLLPFCTIEECSLSQDSIIQRMSTLPTTQANLTLIKTSILNIGDNRSNSIIVDATDVPKVIRVFSSSSNGTYSPGDSITIHVEFSDYVQVTGEPILNLDVGNSLIGNARYFSGTRSRQLTFVYTIEPNHCTHQLEYIDMNSLFVNEGNKTNGKGSIKRASQHPQIYANLRLPGPKSENALSGKAAIIIDCRTPYITSISTPLEKGIFGTDDLIPIWIQFSRPVSVFGSPLLRLETGDIDRVATFEIQLNDQSLQFSYMVQLGDHSHDLEYWTDEGILRSSFSSFNFLNGGSIMLAASNPVIPADIHLNPSFGFLEGYTTMTVVEGEAEFVGLKIGKRGYGYKIRFQSLSKPTNLPLETSVSVDIGISSEFEVFGHETKREHGDEFGSAVSLSHTVLAIGAPYKRNPSHEIQVLTVAADSRFDQSEVQLITTQLDTIDSIQQIQRFSTVALTNETISGSFALKYIDRKHYLYGAPVVIPSDAGSDQLQILLQEAFPLLGDVSVSRTRNVECSCKNGWTWSITFLDASNGISLLQSYGHDLQGPGSTITATELVRPTNMIRGFFTLHNPFNGAVSRTISYDATDEMLKDVIEDDLDISVRHVMVSNMDKRDLPELGRRWTITFTSHIGLYGEDINVPNIQINKSNLEGSNVTVWAHTGFEGKGRLRGSFALSMLGTKNSTYIPHNASGEELKGALESLQSIASVTVSERKEINSLSHRSGFTWTITFNAINRLTAYGWISDPDGKSLSGNLPVMQVSSHLIGWNAHAFIAHEFGGGDMDTQAQWMTKAMGSDGVGSGDVAVYYSESDQWILEAFLKAHDGNSHDQFGQSVRVSGEYIAIGAPAKEVDGFFEKQTLICRGVATDGYFFITFRGHRSQKIHHNATAEGMIDAITGIYGTTYKVHPLPKIMVDPSEEWLSNGAGFCERDFNEVTITFLTPDGGGVSTEQATSGDIEELVVDDSALIGAVVAVHETRKGTRALSGKINMNPTGVQSGSVYVFQRSILCTLCSYTWSQIRKFTQMDGMDAPSDSARFGWSIVMGSVNNNSSKILCIGSPGINSSQGKVYLFEGSGMNWTFHSALTSTVFQDNSPGDNFGYSLALDTDTILVGAPGYQQGKGTVYVYRQEKNEMGYLWSQQIFCPSDSKPGDAFGHSLDLSDNRAVICSPFHDVRNIYSYSHGKHVNYTKNVGSCYVYTRNTPMDKFELMQTLIPSNVRERDRFGWSTAISGNKLLVGQVQSYTGELIPSDPIQILTTSCASSVCDEKLVSTFYLLWRERSLKTRPLSYSIPAKQLKEIMESDLDTGKVSIARTTSPDANGGYSWSITFHIKEKNSNGIPKLECDSRSLTGSDPSCNIELYHNVPNRVRSKVHLFTFSNSSWIEQAFLFPQIPQQQDIFGHAIALQGDRALIGAPNRNLLNINSGAAIAYDLSYSNVKFTNAKYNVSEGNSLMLPFARNSAQTSQIIQFKSMDRNSADTLQTYVGKLYSLDFTSLATKRMTPLDLIYHNKAIGKKCYYGSDENRSLWFDGMFDYRGISDYKSIDDTIMFEVGMTSSSIRLETTDDQVLEVPDESLTVHLDVPGMLASPLGSLKAEVTIIDNYDGLLGNITYYRKFIGKSKKKAKFGFSVDILENEDTVVVGSPEADGINTNGGLCLRSGLVTILKKTLDKWSEMATLFPPLDGVEDNALFGHSVSIDKPYGRDDMTLVIGAPGLARAFVFVYSDTSASWVFQADLRPFNESSLSEDFKFASSGSISINGDVVFIGAPIVETVYVYRRVLGDLERKWEPWSRLQSSKYDYDLYGNDYSIRHIHQQLFGNAVASSDRLLLVGAPYADYGNRGDTHIRELFDTDGVHNAGLGKGAVFAFHSDPHIHQVTFKSNQSPVQGTFVLQLNGSSSAQIPIDGNDKTVKAAIEVIENVGEVLVEIQTNECSAPESEMSFNCSKVWSIAFLSIYTHDLNLIQPRWNGNNCDDCQPFLGDNSSSVDLSFTTEKISTIGTYEEEFELQGNDVNSGDRFGHNLDIDGNDIVVGAMYSSAKTRTTWDFETGDLSGWFKTGDAFDFQPTFGDNSRRRTVYKGISSPKRHTTGTFQSSLMRGRYYIGTYEKRPGNSSDYMKADETFKFGNVQGDDPMGTLTSDPFMIKGSTISFLIGGGCDHLTEYIELLVDGIATLRTTGQCNERMDRVTWTVSEFQNRAAQIRIVDSAKTEWGHINIDEIRFDWNFNKDCLDPYQGVCPSVGGAIPGNSPGAKIHYHGVEETSKAGAAYIFSRQCERSSTWIERIQGIGCSWEEKQRLVASDKREGNLFGSIVAIGNSTVIVGSPAAPAYGFYKEDPNPYPFESTMTQFPVEQNLENLMKSEYTLSPTSGNLRLVNHLSLHNGIGEKQTFLPGQFNQKSGGVYVFLKTRSIDSVNEKLEPWSINEHAKIAPPDVFSNDRFGESVGLSRNILISGSLGQDSVREDNGAAYIFDLSWYSVRFSDLEYVAVEGNHSSINIHLVREENYKNNQLMIGFSTSDLTAIGVDSAKYATCSALPIGQRVGCGDYEQTTGIAEFNSGSTSASFSIQIVNDNCWERHMKYVQLNLHIIGGAAIQGEHYRAQLRIDDDDWVGGENTTNCTVNFR